MNHVAPRRVRKRVGVTHVRSSSLADEIFRESIVSGLTIRLSQRLRESTRDLHTVAERSGIMRPLLRGSLAPLEYAALLRNLHPIYRALEARLRDLGDDPILAVFALPALARSSRIEHDLAAIAGPGWRDTLAVSRVTDRYASRLRDADALSLLAHAYVRYLGDLSGGQHIARIAAQSLGRELANAVAFYDFSEIGDIDGFKDHVREKLDAASLSEASASHVVDEARWAFATHAELFDELERSRVGNAVDGSRR